MGEVWEGTDQLLSRPVAVKILRDELRTAPAFIDRFRAEARHAAGLSHPGIATVYDYGETGEVAYLVMELVPGQTLSELLVEQPGLPTAAKLSILSQTAEALHAAHLAGVIHRDVKPANLIVGPDGTVKVTDFGIARAIGGASLTDAGQVIGTADYMSPEQATGNQATAASDIYSLAVVAYEMFAGRRPFEAETPLAISMAHVHATVPALPAEVPRGIADLIAESLAKEPRSRPPSAGAFAERARREMQVRRPAPTLRLPAATTVTSVQPSLAQTSGAFTVAAAHEDRRRRPRTEPLLAFLAVFLLIAGAIWVFASRSDGDPSAENDRVTSAAAAPTEPPASITPDTSTPATTPVTAAPPTTVPATALPATTVAVATTLAPVATTAESQATVPPVTAGPTTAAPVTAAPVLMPTPDSGPIEEDEALAFVLTYYEHIDAGDYDVSWPSLTQEFRRRPQPHVRELHPILAQYVARTRRAAVPPRTGPRRRDGCASRRGTPPAVELSRRPTS